MTVIPRCPRCGYALIRGLCPIHGGRQVAERLPMMAPLPLARDDAKVLAFAKRKRPRRAS